MKLSRFSVAALLSLSVLSVLGKSSLLDSAPSSEKQPILLDNAPIPLCERTDEVLKQFALDPKMRLSFVNEGGLANGGVCWWHNRFQRAVWLLAEFAPTESPPTYGEARQIVDDLAHQRRIVKIPGYSDFHSFSRDFAPLIQAELDQWQKRDGFVNQAWIQGLKGRSKFRRSSKAMTQMNRLYNQFMADKRMNRITWVMLQMPGVVAHSALVLEMQRARDGGYELTVVDSNRPSSTLKWRYRRGGTYLETGLYGPAMPYAGYGGDSFRMASLRKRYCTQPNPPTSLTSIQDTSGTSVHFDGSDTREQVFTPPNEPLPFIAGDNPAVVWTD